MAVGIRISGCPEDGFAENPNRIYIFLDGRAVLASGCGDLLVYLPLRSLGD